MIKVSVSEQRLSITLPTGETRSYPVSTSSRGTGSEAGSYKTPLGHFIIAKKIGGGEPSGTIFVARASVGMWPDCLPSGVAPDDDLILTRILWLDGLDEANGNTYERYIYIHGTNHEEKLGTPASCGCVRMSNEDMIELYDLVEEGTSVEIG